MKNLIQLINGFHYRAVTETVLKMKKEMGIFNYAPILVLLLLLCFSSVFCACQQNEKAVLAAYQLRIDGKVDAAKEQLELILSEDSTNALAHFEMARTLNYMNMLGSEEADRHLSKALELDPNNVIYAYYNAGNCFLKAYIALQRGGDNATEIVEKSCEEFIHVLELEPDYPEALMYLVEFYGMLPPDLGGDKAKAEKYTQQLEKMDKFYGAKARLVLMPEGTDMAEYWEKFISENGESCKALKELGVACIFNDDITGAKKHFEKAMNLDKSQNIRLLDLARYHQMKVMQNRDAAAEELPKSKVYIEQYLESTPAPIPPMQAYALGMLAKAEMFMGNQEDGQKLMKEAEVLDPYFSRAFGIPSLALFEPPTAINHHFSSFFSPF